MRVHVGENEARLMYLSLHVLHMNLLRYVVPLMYCMISLPSAGSLASLRTACAARA